MTRAERRHHRGRLLVKRRGYAVAKDDPTPKRLGKLARTATPCSCEMCRNQRANEGPTLGERRFNCEPLKVPEVWFDE
jgi:hypothetical protein